jgi:hypothetical protein
MSARHWLLRLAVGVALAPLAAGTQIRPEPTPPPAPDIRTRLPWPRTVSEFDSLRSVAVPLFAPRIGSVVPNPATAYRSASRASRAAPVPRSQCPMPVYPSGPVAPMPGSAPGGAPVTMDTAYVRGVHCDNPLDGRRR